MTKNNFEDREKALENKYFFEEDMKFKVVSRRRKLLGQWAGNKMHLSDSDVEKYAMEIVGYGIEDNTEGAVVKKIVTDIRDTGFKVEESEVRKKMEEFQRQAQEQVEAALFKTAS